jgi:hypothetical protein
MSRQPLLKIATNPEQAAKFIDNGDLKDFTVVLIESPNTEYLSGYYYIKAIDPWLKNNYSTLEYLNKLRQAVKSNANEFRNKGSQTVHCVYFREDETEQRLIYYRYTPE